ncbi:MAG: condensation domain-containing protein, partial [Psychrosphaera sp.]|nr:condensation domain-containing protein [Psychrosphaera sp.]
MSSSESQIPVLLHSAQENVYFEQLRYARSSMYNLGWYSLCNSHYDPELLHQSWQLLYDHLDALRMQICVADDGSVEQIFKAPAPVNTVLGVKDFSDVESPLNSAMQWIGQQVDQPCGYLNG